MRENQTEGSEKERQEREREREKEIIGQTGEVDSNERERERESDRRKIDRNKRGGERIRQEK